MITVARGSGFSTGPSDFTRKRRVELPMGHPDAGLTIPDHQDPDSISPRHYYVSPATLVRLRSPSSLAGRRWKGIKCDLVRRAIRSSQEQSRFRGRNRERSDTQPMCCPRIFELAKEYGPDTVDCVLL